MNKLGVFETQVYEQILAEYPDMKEEEGAELITYVNTQTSRHLRGNEAVVYYVCNKMWDAFDEAMIHLEKDEWESRNG